MTAQPIQHQIERLLEQIRTRVADPDGTRRGGSPAGVAPALTQHQTEMQ